MFDKWKCFLCDEFTGVFFYIGGIEVVFFIWVDVYLVRGGVVKYEWWVGVFVRGFISEFSVDLL